MSMIHIKETIVNENSVAIRVDGALHQGSIPVLKKVCQNYFGGTKKIILDLKGVTYITREGRDFLKKIRHEVTFLSIPPFVELNQD